MYYQFEDTFVATGVSKDEVIAKMKDGKVTTDKQIAQFVSDLFRDFTVEEEIEEWTTKPTKNKKKKTEIPVSKKSKKKKKKKNRKNVDTAGDTKDNQGKTISKTISKDKQEYTANGAYNVGLPKKTILKDDQGDEIDNRGRKIIKVKKAVEVDDQGRPIIKVSSLK